MLANWTHDIIKLMIYIIHLVTLFRRAVYFFWTKHFITKLRTARILWNQICIAMLTRPRHFSLSQSRWVQPTPFHHTYVRSILILSFPILLILLIALFTSVLSTNISYAFFPPYMLHSSHPIILVFYSLFLRIGM